METRVEQVPVQGGSCDLHLWLPEGERGPGVLVIQEIFGISSYIEAVAGDLARLGYVVAAPDLFWRLRPGWRADHDETGLRESLALAQRFDFEQGVADAAAALGHLTRLPEVDGETGIVGFCLGGSIAFVLAARNEAAAVASYYGSAVAANLGLAERIERPLQLQFGGSDPYIPRADVAKIEAAVRDRPGIEIHVEEQAGHAFHNREAPMFYDAEPAARAWRRTEDFLARHLRPGAAPGR